MFGSAFLLKLYLAGALTGSSVFLADIAFIAPRKEVTFLQHQHVYIGDMGFNRGQDIQLIIK